MNAHDWSRRTNTSRDQTFCLTPSFIPSFRIFLLTPSTYPLSPFRLRYTIPNVAIHPL